MASGPCGSQFKEAFSCFHYSKEEVKGSECIDHFRDMQECMQRYPELYPQDDETDSSSQEAESRSALPTEKDSTAATSTAEAAVSADGTSPTDEQTAS